MKQIEKDKQFLKSPRSVDVPVWNFVLAKVIVGFFIFTVILLALTPWVQTSQGVGRIIALNPNDRVQNISATVPGIVKKWYVRDGSLVKEGDPVVEVVDNDPSLLKRLELERDAIKSRFEAAKIARETGFLNYQRQEELFKEGLSSRTKFEKAKIDYKKLLASEASAAADLAKAEVSLSRQETQLIRAPKDGTILRVLPGAGSIYVKEGDLLATFVPQGVKLAAEVFIDGNDLPLVYPGRTVRLQFEGWPAVQFSGWPSVAVGTFGGKVLTVDQSVSENGKFRVLVVPESANAWPDETYLRQGAKVYGWILLNTVKLGYELWRQFNGFPASMEDAPEDQFVDSALIYQSDKSKNKNKKKESKSSYYKDKK